MSPKTAGGSSSTLAPHDDGLGADVPEDDTILRQWVLTNLTRYRTLVERVTGRIDVWDGAALFDTESPNVFDNAAVLRRPVTATEVEELVETAHLFFPPDRPWLLLSAWPLPNLASAGLQLMGHPPFMMRPAGPPVDARQAVDGLEIREVTPDLGADLHPDTRGGLRPAGYADIAVVGPACVRPRHQGLPRVRQR